MSEAQKYQQLRRELKKRVKYSQKKVGELQTRMRKVLGVSSISSSEVFKASREGKFDVWHRWLADHYFEYTANVAKYSSLLRKY